MRILKGALLPLLLALAVSCGLPGTYYLEPPDTSAFPPATGSGQSFRLTTTDRSGDIAATFLGYEYYYKCFGSDSDATFTSDQGYGSEYYDYIDPDIPRLSPLLPRAVKRLRHHCGFIPGLELAASPEHAPDRSLRPAPRRCHRGGHHALRVSQRHQPARGTQRGPRAACELPAIQPAFRASCTPGPVDPVAMEVRRYVAGTGSQCKTFDSNATVSDNWLSGGTDVDLPDAVYQAVLPNHLPRAVRDGVRGELRAGRRRFHGPVISRVPRLHGDRDHVGRWAGIRAILRV